ncbi:hypothetical protein KUV26_03640 [Leisingera daeponensis]|uniref:DUF4376 domain-containing protein n=1 Tax=Leisingera daeponensis TaxID=405746 RepID=A0ABS7NBF4_9RHOB|nr:hypothetical protein [Leisingera daeponensis]MBY6138518.1 hypothetical protein [Leisingera daeponensis]
MPIQIGINQEHRNARLQVLLTDELERRLAVGFDYDFGDSRGTHRIGTTPADMKRWVDEVSPAAQALINVGQPDATIDLKTEVGPVSVTAAEWQQVLVAAMLFRQPIFQAYFTLKAESSLPSDFTDDKYWP